jgi:dipeptidyl aminopeptidase/acylaminoacyl peptidase
MKLKNAVTGVTTFILVVAVLLLPALFRNRSSAPLVGPDLSSLTYKEIYFRNGDLQLAGMIFVPEGEGPFPVSVIIHGSGSSRRANKWYLSVIRYLQENGIAVLLPDKRGSERSEGNWIGADFETLAGDTMAAVDYVRNQKLFTYSGIGLTGMSQGGWIAPIAAVQDKDIAYVVSMSGAGVTTKQQLAHEEIQNISHYTWPFVARILAPITARRILKMDHVKPYAGYDPLPYWKKVDVPVFFAFGENDENVPVDASIEVLKKNLNIDLIKVYPHGGHAIKDKETNRVQDEFLDDLVGFIMQSSGTGAL